MYNGNKWAFLLCLSLKQMNSGEIETIVCATWRVRLGTSLTHARPKPFVDKPRGDNRLGWVWVELNIEYTKSRLILNLNYLINELEM